MKKKPAKVTFDYLIVSDKGKLLQTNTLTYDSRRTSWSLLECKSIETQST